MQIKYKQSRGALFRRLYLVLKSTSFLRCVLDPGESLHVFGTVLTRLHVGLHNVLGDVLCRKTKNTHQQTHTHIHKSCYFVYSWSSTCQGVSVMTVRLWFGLRNLKICLHFHTLYSLHWPVYLLFSFFLFV